MQLKNDLKIEYAKMNKIDLVVSVFDNIKEKFNFLNSAFTICRY